MAEPIAQATARRTPFWLSYVPEVAVVILAFVAVQVSYNGMLSGRVPTGAPTTCPLPSAVDVSGLKMGQIDEHHALDRVLAGQSDILLGNHTGPIALSRDTALEIDGWAVDSSSKATSPAVYVVINGKPIFAKVGIARPDVASALDNINFENAGFALVIPAGSLPIGHSNVTLRAAAADHSVFYLLQPGIAVDVSP